jgi:hypothetical protein
LDRVLAVGSYAEKGGFNWEHGGIFESSRMNWPELGCMSTARKLGPHTQTDRGTCPGGGALSLLPKPLHYRAGGKENWHCRVGVAELARCVGEAARRELRGGNCAARLARRDLRGALGFSCCLIVLVRLPRCNPALGFSRCVLVFDRLLRCSLALLLPLRA